MIARLELPPVTEGIEYDKESRKLLSYNAKILKYDVFRLPEGVTEIPNNFFAGKLFADKLILPSTLKRVGADAFSNTIIREMEFLGGGEQGL